ncbi:helix-turn-helix transcriptional regulator [Dysgonomonas sp. 511]|uniref:helix-turn-helix domain-containing protein n=1 Tax=Dysgonomonas sp. 511 TaxID=2302930 RepID=UPI0013D89619|nr:helix-turn-helix transcriptional regulator [Dysgonomonas sp. 511]NDV78709.1 XRE family transcriptional regulator [Dysgonomonas sp. 511]
MAKAETTSRRKPDQGFNMKARRMDLGWTQEMLADRLNDKYNLKLHQTKISELENKETIAEETLKQLADVMECDLEFLRDFTISDYFKKGNMTFKVEAETITASDNAINEIEQNENKTINNYFPPEVAQMYKDLMAQEKESQAREMACLTKEVEALSREIGRLQERLGEK